jgi:aminoglycoside phosphotransferase (APT) family kinase protein
MKWVAARRELYTCARPSPVHHDFHPGNILVRADGSAAVIDWTSFGVTDARFDLAWTLMLAHAYGWPEAREQILQGYQRHAGKQVEHIEAFEAIECARRLLDLTVVFTSDAQRMGMNAQVTETIRASMEAHRRVHRLFIERTGLQIEAFDTLFG